jgi:hypothetical protein
MIRRAREPAPAVRPATVTVAFWLQVAAVAVLLLLIGLVVWHAVYWNGEIDRAVRLVPDADPDEVAAERWSNVFISLLVGTAALVLAGWLAVTAPFIRRGSNAARILIFAAAGVQLLICLGPTFLAPFTIPFAIVGGAWPQEPPPEATDLGWEPSTFFETLYAEPDPAGDAFLAAGALGVGTVFLLIVAVVLLLTLPPAGRYFVPRVAPAGPYPLPGAASRTPSVPPGYLICPDPALHLVHPPTAAAPPPPPASPGNPGR